MDVFDYLLGKKKDNIIFDDLGNAYLYYDAEISASYIDNFMINGIKQVDLAYLRLCIEAYGVDADTALSKVIKYQIEGL